MDACLLNPKSKKRIRVLIVDDSSLTRWLMRELIDTDPGLEVVGMAQDALAGRKLIKSLKPDVITLDVEMPGMNGLDFLGNIMRLHPMPVVMVSSLTERGAEITLEALSLGAVDFVCKPKHRTSGASLDTYRSELIDKIKVASVARVRRLKSKSRASPAVLVRTSLASSADASGAELVAIGASTGGTEAIVEILQKLPSDGPAVLLVQHISDAFNAPFVKRLDRLLATKVRQASDGELIRRGHVYVAPAGAHLGIRGRRGNFTCKLSHGGRVNFHKPAVDELFRSVAKAAGKNAVGVILTGMGSDGALGLAAMRRAGARTIAQDERTSVVWGMPGSAVKLGAVERVVPLADVAGLIKSLTLVDG